MPSVPTPTLLQEEHSLLITLLKGQVSRVTVLLRIQNMRELEKLSANN
jgi:hypothetical protein